ncbi:ATP-grasp fold amidoligase family protein [Pseudonocardia sp. GCM10023141]|uniref:ATP-grasp fold amidoligase family protein n=1 Tax=Pseudonocardia sp. GCM10023141 TaxID=3252653 RepID=UPI0036237C48
MLPSARVVLARRLRFLPDPLFAAVLHAIFQGEISTLRHPRTWSQLLAAKNLQDPDEVVHTTTDKYAVRAYVADRIGDKYLIPLLQVVDRADDLDFDALTRPCVIKGTHGCDMTLLIRDVQSMQRWKVRATVRKWLDTDFYEAGWRERPYRGLPRRAVVEEFIGDGVTAPTDYKFFMFHGRPAMVVVDQDRFTAHTSTMLSVDWKPFKITGRFAGAATLPEQPADYAEMLAVAQKLSSEFEFVRIDLYNVDGRIYFGEITHNPGGGMVRLQPRDFDLALGDLWRNGTPVPARFVDE